MHCTWVRTLQRALFLPSKWRKTMDDSWVFSSVTNKDDRDEDQCTLRFLLPRSLFLTNYLRADSDVLTLVP